MNIAVFGYYNHLNAGDDRLQYCLTRLLKGHTVVFLPHYTLPPNAYLNTFDWILIGGGGLIFERVGIWQNVKGWSSACRANIGVIGIGVNRIGHELEEELAALIDRCHFFYVRDQESKQLLDHLFGHHSKVEVLPDLSWCYPLSTSVSKEATGIALNLLPCTWKPYEPEAWVEALEALPTRPVRPFPFHFGDDRDADLLKSFFPDYTPEEFTLEPLLRSKILLACRFHAIIFAMQVGQLFIAINYDVKVHRLLAEANLTELELQTNEPHLLQEKLAFVNKNEEMLRAKISTYVSEQISKAVGMVEKSQQQISAASDNKAWSMKPYVKKLLLRK